MSKRINRVKTTTKTQRKFVIEHFEGKKWCESRDKENKNGFKTELEAYTALEKIMINDNDWIVENYRLIERIKVTIDTPLDIKQWNPS